jgi:uncharacterized membrane protein YphA (DoxX/SURF4 family)
MKNLGMINRVLLGLLVLVPGLLKLLVTGPAGVTGMLSGNFLFSWAPAFWAWILIAGEILFGAAILLNWKTEYASYGASAILFFALITAVIRWSDLGSTGWSNALLHLVAISNYLLLAMHVKKK